MVVRQVKTGSPIKNIHMPKAVDRVIAKTNAHNAALVPPGRMPVAPTTLKIKRGSKSLEYNFKSIAHPLINKNIIT